ncbi:MAG: hypothetical protein KDA22_09640 [Phycisphaerales bacterium]|nr:hypothetical protein [Phycisphaerales bacterium]
MRHAVRAFLSAFVVLLAAAAPGFAQATPIAHGNGVYEIQGEPLLLSFNVVELPNGEVRGHVFTKNQVTGGILHSKVTSYMFLDDVLLVAGPLTAAVNAPPQFVLGATKFYAFKDNGDGTPPDEVTGGVAPIEFGDLTIQQIVAIGGGPPPSTFMPLTAGDITIN